VVTKNRCLELLRNFTTAPGNNCPDNNVLLHRANSRKLLFDTRRCDAVHFGVAAINDDTVGCQAAGKAISQMAKRPRSSNHRARLRGIRAFDAFFPFDALEPLPGISLLPCLKDRYQPAQSPVVQRVKTRSSAFAGLRQSFLRMAEIHFFISLRFTEFRPL
jgi:hypothetical protein